MTIEQSLMSEAPHPTGLRPATPERASLAATPRVACAPWGGESSFAVTAIDDEPVPDRQQRHIGALGDEAPDAAWREQHDGYLERAAPFDLICGDGVEVVVSSSGLLRLRQ
jgi:hypothetical protein